MSPEMLAITVDVGIDVLIPFDDGFQHGFIVTWLLSWLYLVHYLPSSLPSYLSTVSNYLSSYLSILIFFYPPSCLPIYLYIYLLSVSGLKPFAICLQISIVSFCLQLIFNLELSIVSLRFSVFIVSLSLKPSPFFLA